MVRTHARSESPAPNAQAGASEPGLLKRMKMSHISNPDDAVAERFANDLFNPTNIHRLHGEYEASQPYKHVVVDKLFQDDLLQKVKDEALAELSFAEKETDIYKVCAPQNLSRPGRYHRSLIRPNACRLSRPATWRRSPSSPTSSAPSSPTL